MGTFCVSPPLLGRQDAQDQRPTQTKAATTSRKRLREVSGVETGQVLEAIVLQDPFSILNGLKLDSQLAEEPPFLGKLRFRVGRRSACTRSAGVFFGDPTISIFLTNIKGAR